jgi:hypothetical protein
MAKIIYKIIEKKEDLKESIVKKSGFSIEFTLNDFLYNIQYNKKQRKEIAAKVGIEDATMQNVLHFHPEVKELSEETLQAAYVYQKALSVIKVGNEKIAELDAQIESDMNELKEITKQTGLAVILKTDENVQAEAEVKKE